MPQTSDQPTPAVPIVRAVIRSLEVLNAFAGKGVLSLTEVSHATGLDKGTTRRLLITLMTMDFITHDTATGRYRLGRAIHDLAANVEDSRDLREVARPALLELANEVPVTAFLSVFKDGKAVCLDRVHDMRGIEVHWWAIGGTLPLNCGGAPKLLLAYQPADQIDQLLDQSSAVMSDVSITDRKILRERLALIRSRGWECAVDDVAIGLTALAVPVLDNDGYPICAVSMAGLTPQMMQGEYPIHLKKLQNTAAKIRRALGVATFT